MFSFEFNDTNNKPMFISFVMILDDEDIAVVAVAAAVAVAILAHNINVISDVLGTPGTILLDDKSNYMLLLMSLVGVLMPSVIISLALQEHGILTFKKASCSASVSSSPSNSYSALTSVSLFSLNI